MKYVIFYSWQSDLPNNTNRGFIEAVIEKAIKDIRDSDAYELEPSIDRDTQGLPGSPNITTAILEKISKCDAFVADVSIVTGTKERGQRLSPNPNVLLELGYAISSLGWEKIILFCNEAHGAGEDLPFDIRQHRRISYRLEQSEPKADKRNDLANHFKEKLVELLQKGKSSIGTKQPSLDVLWNYLNVENENKPESVINTKVIKLQAADDLANLRARIAQEIQKAKGINGSGDPDWNTKLETYLKKANQFLEQLNNRTTRENYLIDSNAKKAVLVTLSVENNGTAAASDIRVNIPIPEWLLAFEMLPEKSDIPTNPVIPTPSPPVINARISSFGGALNIGHMLPGIIHSLPTLDSIHRTSACYLEEKEIKLWADRLLHKHEIINTNDRFFLLAMPGSPKGEVTLKGKVFCSEYDDWKETELVIHID